MLDLLLRAARLPDGRGPVDIAIKGGRIVDIAPGLEAEAAEVIDASDRWSLPPSSIRISTWTPR
jgi:cytosine deaminase